MPLCPHIPTNTPHSYHIKKLFPMRLITLIVLILLHFNLFAQENYTLSGHVKDAQSGEEMIGAIVSIKEDNTIRATTNAYGFYSLTIPKGTYTVVVKYIGYQLFAQTIDLSQNISVNVVLKPSLVETNEVVVTGKKESDNVSGTQVGMQKIQINEISKIPVIFGEKDILKTLQLLPGVKSAGDGNSGFYVRGSNSDGNLILLDEAVVYNASHLLGFFSTFNSDALKDVTLYKNAMPANFGGRTASVLDVKMKEGNNQQFGVSGGIGLIASRLSIEGPIVKDKGSFLISGRRTYADMFLKLSSDATISKSSLYFYDLNLKANYQWSAKDRVFISSYLGRDNLGLGSTFGIDWGNATATLRWNHQFSPKLFLNTSAIYSKYTYNINLNTGSGDIGIKSMIDNYNLKEDFTYFLNPKNTISFGLQSTYHQITPGQLSSKDTSIIFRVLQNKYALENAVYVSNEMNISTRWRAIYGLRCSMFSLLGGGDFFTYNSKGEVTNTQSYADGEFIKTYLNLEPRLSVNYALTESSSLKLGFARNAQNLHLISNSTSSNPTDLWIPSSQNVKPETSNQTSLGYFKNFLDNQFECSAEAYYKSMSNSIDYKDAANTRANDKVEGELLYGIGRAYGVELLLKKKTGRLTGWVGYTLSKTEKKIEGINQNQWYNARQDKTHDISIVGMFDITSKWTISSTWVYSTGFAVTFPSGKYAMNNEVKYYYTERNAYRMPAYHRLDLGATYAIKKSATRESSLNFSLYNAYGRENAYSITFRESVTDPTKTEALQTALFRWVPAITWNFKF